MSRQILKIAPSLIGIMVGVAGAVMMFANANGHAASAAFHCTRYAPVYTIDYQCYTSQDPFPEGSAETTSYAWRDDNYIYMSSAGHWQLSFENAHIDCCYWIGCNIGFGYSGSCAAWSEDGAYAKCQNWDNVGPAPGDPPTSGHCGTDWHD